MPLLQLDSIRQLHDKVGQEIVVGDWLEITQDRIDRFAEATDDRQWIHIDGERARRESGFGSTIAHGFLTLSLLSRLLNDAVKFGAVKMGVNYGFNHVRFTAPVPAGARIRARFKLNKLDDLPPLAQAQSGGVQTTWGVTVEREGSDKPCLVAEWVTRRYE